MPFPRNSMAWDIDGSGGGGSCSREQQRAGRHCSLNCRFTVCASCVRPCQGACCSPRVRQFTHSLKDVSARHSSQAQPCLCGAAVWSFVHALRSCPLFVPWRRAWAYRSHLSRLSAVEQLPDDVFLHLLFSPQHPCNTVGLLSAHMPL